METKYRAGLSLSGNKIFLNVVILIVFLFTTAAGAAVDPFAKEIGARPLALGDAFAGFSNGGAGIFYNPAGVAYPQYRLTNSFSSPAENISLTILGGTFPGFLRSSFGIGYRNRTTANITASDETVSYGEQDVSLLFAKKINKYLSLGGDVRFISQALSKDVSGYEGLNGRATVVDLGLKYTLFPWMEAGVALRGLGGKFVYGDGYSEDITANTIAGLSYKDDRRNLSINLDINKIAEEPLAQGHLGLEWNVNEMLALRGGADQTPKSAAENYTHWTAGFGLKWKGLTFDYAAKKWTDAAQAMTYYFSLGYAWPEVKPPKMIHFKDVPKNYWARKPIEYLTALGVLNYYPDETFRPESPISRAEIVMLLVRAKDFPAPKELKEVFSDVPISYWAASHIQTAYEKKLTVGYPNKNFMPRKTTSRVEGTVFLNRFENKASALSKTPLAPPFEDVPISHWGIQDVLKAKEEGLLNYLKNHYFLPDQGMTRAELAEVLFRTNYVKHKIEDAGLDLNND